MKLIERDIVQKRIEQLVDAPVYIHLEMTMGAYTSHRDPSVHPASNFIKNAVINFSHGYITEDSPYRIGLKMDHGWVYTEGLTHYDELDDERLILSGNDKDGRLVVAFQLSRKPF